MTQAIFDGISLALARDFPEYAIYGDEKIAQGLETPAFFMGLGECRTRPLPCGLLEIQQTVNVMFFPGNKGDYSELWTIGPRALRLMRAIRLPDELGQVRGSTLSCAVVDGLMHVRGVYTFRVWEVDVDTPGALMRKMIHRTGLGG